MKYKNHCRANARLSAVVCKTGGIAILTILAITFISASWHNPAALMCLGAIIPMIPRSQRFFDPADDDHGASWSEDELEDMPEGKFRAKVLGVASSASAEMKKIRKDIDAKVDDWQKENKKTVEELTRLKNSVTDTGELAKSLKKVMDAREREYRLATASLSPVRRVIADPVKRAHLNLLVRMACDRNDLTPAIEALRKDLDSENTPGNTLINSELLPEVYDTLGTYGIWNTLGVRRLGTKTTNMPVKTSRVLATWVEEAAAIGADNAKAGTTAPATVKKVASLIAISRELLMDAQFDVTADVLDDMAEAIAFRMDHSFFNGDGTADNLNGGFTGVMNAGTAAVAADGNTTIESLAFEDFIRCLTSVAAAVLSRAARWWMHPTAIARTLAVRDGNGRPIFLTGIEAPTYGGIGSILGYPVTPGHALPSANVAGTKVAAFGDPQGYVVGLRQDIEFATSDHVGFETDERAFRAIARAAGKMRRADAISVLTLAAQ